MRRLIYAIVLLGGISLHGVAVAQTCNGQYSAGQICGNSTATLAPPKASTLGPIIDLNFGAPSAQGTILNRGSSSWGATTTPVLGNPAISNGSLGIANTAGGTATITSTGNGNPTFRLPANNGTSGFVLITDGSGNTSWVANTTGGTVSSVGLALPVSVFSITGSPVTSSGTLTGSFISQAANLIWGGPATGSPTTPTFRSLVGADLPNPTTLSLGGIQAINAVANNWINSINGSGVPQLSQPAFTNISGVVAASQLPNPTATTLGGVKSFAAVTSQWINSISTSGTPTASQPAFTDISGSLVAAQLPVIGNNTILANISGGSTFPTPSTTSAILDATIGNSQGDILYRGATTWAVLTPGTNGQVLTTAGAAANPTWTSVTGTGTVTSVGTGTGLTGGTITTSGTISLDVISAGTVLANVTGGSAAPISNTVSAVLDVIDTTEGDILYRGASNWLALGPGTNGQILQTQGPGATPQWANVGSVSSVGIVGGTNINATGTCTITTSGTCTLALPTTLTGPFTLSGTVNHTGTFQSNGNTITFPATAASMASLNLTNQVVTGGATNTPVNLGTITSGTLTPNCGSGQLQYATFNGSFTLAAPTNDSSCLILVTNGASVGTVNGSAYKQSPGAYAGYVGTATYQFILSILRINGVSTLYWTPLQ